MAWLPVFQLPFRRGSSRLAAFLIASRELRALHCRSISSNAAIFAGESAQLCVLGEVSRYSICHGRFRVLAVVVGRVVDSLA
jgi:hypothetical protein